MPYALQLQPSPKIKIDFFYDTLAMPYALQLQLTPFAKDQDYDTLTMLAPYALHPTPYALRPTAKNRDRLFMTRSRCSRPTATATAKGQDYDTLASYSYSQKSR
jgi:hypothetical protein